MAELIEETDDKLVLRKLIPASREAIDPPSKLSFTWISKNTDFKTTLVTVELLQRGDQTE